MMGKGEKILEVLVDAERDGLYAGSTHLSTIAQRVTGTSDGRSVTASLRRLETAGLAERHRGAGSVHPGWIPTERGRDVDRILREISADRGGAFRPQREAGISYDEIHAIR